MQDDPIEKDPKLGPLVEKAAREAEAELEAEGWLKHVMGYCHAFWPTQKRILREKYGIEWRTPSEMNPDVLFD
jgi:hypothetical protein